MAHGRRGRGHRLCDRRGGEYRAYQRALFLAYGLAKGAYLGTEAMGSLAIYAAKALTHCCGRVPAQAASGSSCMASNCSSSICTWPCQ